jgi:hypothetical protein
MLETISYVLSILLTLTIIIYFVYVIYTLYKQNNVFIGNSGKVEKEKKKQKRVHGMSDLKKDSIWDVFADPYKVEDKEREYFNDRNVKKLGKLVDKKVKDKVMTCKVNGKEETKIINNLLYMTSLNNKILLYDKDNKITYDGKEINGKNKYSCFAFSSDSLYMGVEGKKEIEIYKDGKFSSLSIKSIPLSLLTYKDGFIVRDINGIIYEIDKQGKVKDEFFLTDRNGVKIIGKKIILDNEEKYLYALCDNLVIKVDIKNKIVSTYNVQGQDILCRCDELWLINRENILIIPSSFNEIKKVKTNYHLLPSMINVNDKVYIVAEKEDKTYILEINNKCEVIKENHIEIDKMNETPLITYGNNSIYTYTGEKLLQLNMICNSI